MVKNHIFIIVACWVFLFSWVGASSQIVEVELDPWNEMSLLYAPQQEKLYLHFDKPYYATGERMWFRAYLLDASSLSEDTLNNAIYVELINNRDSLVYRQKLNKINSCFSGSFRLEETLSEGSYWVRAYTNNMRNAGESFFFKRPFFIGNNLSSEVKTNADYKFISNKQAFVEILFERKKIPMALQEVGYRLNIPGKKSKRKKTIETTYNGILRYEYNPKKLYDKRPSITVFYEDSINKYERTFLLPTKNEFDVQIFPEGSVIVLGTTNCIAFKAIKTNGLSIDVEGTLYDNEDKKVTSFKSEHLGMGKFCYYTEKFKRYYVVFKTSDGETQRIDLPNPKKDAFALGGVVKYGRILIHVKSEMARIVNDSLVLVGHMGGTIFYSGIISGLNPAVVFNIEDLHPGIAHFVLLDKNGDSISERLAFVRPEQTTEVNLDFSKLAHEKRRPVHCMIIAKDSKGNPIDNGSFSISVTDAKAVELDPSSDNIMSNLMLTSDIKGYIEKPGLYFDPANKNAEVDIDLLLMTQGWRRFNTKKVLEGELKEDRFSIENGIELSGQVNAGSVKKPLENIEVMAYSPNILFFNNTKTDSLGRFSFENLRFTNRTPFSIEARREIHLDEKIKINIDSQEFPDIDYNVYPENAATPVTDEYMDVANEKYFNENGIRNIYTKRRGLISFTPQRNIEERDNEQIAYSNEEYVLEGYLLEKRQKEKIPDLLKTIPGMKAWNEQLQTKTANNNYPSEEIITGPRFAIDGINYSYNELKNISVKDLESIRILKKSNNDDWENTLVALSFKASNPVSSDKHHISSVMPLGYADNVLFYVPKYESFWERGNPIPDWRSTIAFIPEVRTGPTGKAVFTFYTADRLSPYNIEIEGISPQGEPCRMTTKKMLLYTEQQHLIEK